MLYVILGIILGGIFGIHSYNNELKEQRSLDGTGLCLIFTCGKPNKLEKIITMEFFGFILGVSFWLLFGSLFSVCLPCEYICEEVNLVELEYNSDKYISLGGDNLYIYNMSTSEGNIIKKLDMSTVYVSEGNFEPHIKIYKPKYSNKLFYLFTTLLFKPTYAEIYIPNGGLECDYVV